MEHEKLLSQLLPYVGPAMKDSILKKSEINIAKLGDTEVIKISCKTFDDPNRKSKRFQPITIRIHEDFGTSEFSKSSFAEISTKFTSFIINKCNNFIPRTTENIQQPHTDEYWIFPPEC